MKIRDWLKVAKRELASLDAELILLETLRRVRKEKLLLDRSELVKRSEDELGLTELKMAENLLKQRKSGLALAYILGYKEFYGRKFKVNKEVLIPRPETEEVLEVALTRVQKIRSERDLAKRVKVVDVGTGSGCIACSVALENAHTEVLGLDISAEALVVAKQNARELGAEVEFRQSDLIEQCEALPDIIVANLPYVDKNWSWNLDLDFEPRLALYAENKGLALIKLLLDKTKEKWYNEVMATKSRVFVILEADTCQHEEIIKYAKSNKYKFLKTRGLSLELELS